MQYKSDCVFLQSLLQPAGTLLIPVGLTHQGWNDKDCIGLKYSIYDNAVILEK